MTHSPHEGYDLIVIGGGITGAGIARDAAMRGLKTLLLERRDFGAGTTGRSMGMLHGGVRYVFSDPEVTYRSCLESGYIQRIAPHLCFRIPWLTLLNSERKVPAFEAAFAYYDRWAPLKGSKPHVLLTPEEARRQEPALAGDFVAAITMDEPGVDVFRLTLLNILSAHQFGARVRNHTEVVEVLRKGGRAAGIRAFDHRSHSEVTAWAEWIVNAAGPWTPQVAQLAGIPFRLKPTKGVHIIFDRRVTNVAVNCSEGIEILPHESVSLAGLTDTLFLEDPDKAVPERDEVEYLLRGLEGHLPQVRQARLVRAMAGVRPLIDQPGTHERHLSRRHQIYDHGELNGLEGFITVAGGKMVLYRLMAEETVNLICRRMGRRASCRTTETPLPGGERKLDPVEIAGELGLSLHTTHRALSRHGTRITEIFAPREAARQTDPRGVEHICLCEPVTWAEIRHARDVEWAVTLDDLRRRTRMGTGPCQGMGCSARVAQWLVGEGAISHLEAHEQVEEFLQERWKGRRPALGGHQLAQEALTRALYIGMGGYGKPTSPPQADYRPSPAHFPPPSGKRILVIGGGMAGAVAAISASQGGAEVTLLRRGYGATALSSGMIDLSLPAPFPVTEATIAEAVNWLCQELRDSGLHYIKAPPTPTSLLTSFGRLRRGDLIPASFAAGDPLSWRRGRDGAIHLAIVGVPGFADFSPNFLAHAWPAELEQAYGIESSMLPLWVPLPGIHHPANLSAFELAERLEEDQAAGLWADAIAGALPAGNWSGLALPPVVGLSRPAVTLETIQDRLGIPCFEAPSGTPSVPGFRLQKALDAAMLRAGVQIIPGWMVGFDSGPKAGRRIQSAQVHSAAAGCGAVHSIETDLVILASGSFIGRGIRETGTGKPAGDVRHLEESSFDLPLFSQDGEPLSFQDGTIDRLTAHRFLDYQPLFSCGLKVDACLSPQDFFGARCYENLLAAGAILAGGWWGAEGGSLGRALITGYLAGRLASRGEQ